MNNKQKLTEDDKYTLRIMGIYATATTLSSVSSTVLYKDTQKEIKSFNKGLNTYVQSMSDEELESALQKFNLLEQEQQNKEIIK